MRHKKTLAVVVSITISIVTASLIGCAPADISKNTPAPIPTPSRALTENQLRTQGIIACLKENGWEVEFDELTNSYSFSGPIAQMEQYEKDEKACLDKFPVEIRGLDELTEDDWASWYSEEKRMSECLRGLGVSIPEMPSRQTFIDKAIAGDAWVAYEFVGNVGQAKNREYLTKCPQTK